jgi:hypothetical protein
VELLFIAQFYKMPIAEIAVNWTEIDGSKVTPIFSWIQMLDPSSIDLASLYNKGLESTKVTWKLDKLIYKFLHI